MQILLRHLLRMELQDLGLQASEFRAGAQDLGELPGTRKRAQKKPRKTKESQSSKDQPTETQPVTET
jgi:hypothetical protein